ncbi:MAG: hypothetical protein ACK4K7_09555 [Allosphingosinicella sp.]|uniref:hypothetical protein n=1 Tax=Allosphingosinicella sp. TaxID=2823234 RepID=UPI00395D0A8B
MKRFLLCAAGAVLIAGCGRSGAEQPEAIVASAYAGESPSYAQETSYQERIRLLDEGSRNAVFLRSLRDAGIGCQQVAESVYLGTVHGHASWAATCRERTQWLVTVGGDDVARIMSLDDAHRTHHKRGPGQAAG